MAIALPGELQESVGTGFDRAQPSTNRALRAVCGRSLIFLQTIARADMPWRGLEGRFGCQVNCRK